MLSFLAHYKDYNGVVVSLKHLKLTLQNVNHHPPQPTVARKYLNSSVSNITESRMTDINIDEYNLSIPAATPWFEAWRDIFLQVQYPSDHEFTKHYLACMLIVSSNDEDPLSVIVSLDQKINELQSSAFMPKWFNNNNLKYYVLIHENIDQRNIR